MRKQRFSTVAMALIVTAMILLFPMGRVSPDISRPALAGPPNTTPMAAHLAENPSIRPSEAALAGVESGDSDETSHGLRLDASSWHIETVDSEGGVGEYTSLALDGSGYPHISYYGSGGLKYTSRMLPAGTLRR
jgi:hypothetical protein